MERLLHIARSALEAYLERGTLNATAEAALSMRRVRAFGLIGVGLLGIGSVAALLTPGASGAAPWAFGALAIEFCLLRLARTGAGRFTATSYHLAMGLLLAVITVGAVHLGGAHHVSVTLPSLMIIATAHVLGVGAAAFWTAISIAVMGVLVAGAVLPDPIPGAAQAPRPVMIGFRAVILLSVFGLAAMGRRFEDRQRDRMLYLARHDPLTGLLNRRAFDERLRDALARAERYGHRVALLFVDLDGFKKVNDQCGHARGDELLQECAARIRSITRATDAAGRTGGDEFVVLLESIPETKSAEAYASRLLELCAPRPDRAGIEASLGVALYPDHARDAESLTQAADAAMYAAKRAGGGRLELAAEGTRG